MELWITGSGVPLVKTNKKKLLETRKSERPK
jgi:hypothetical protein